MKQAEFWSDVLEKIRGKISEPSYQTWLSETKASIHNDVLTVVATNEFAADWLQERYKPLISNTVKEFTGKTYEIQFTYPGNISLEWIQVESKRSVQLEQFIRDCIEKQTKELKEIVRDHEERIQELEELLEFEEVYNKFIPYEKEEGTKRIYFDLNSYIEVDVDEETFYDEFQEWLDSKGWSYVSLAKRTQKS